MEKTNKTAECSKMYANLDKNKSQEPKKPFIITKDALQAKVFGAGYPSLPVYSIEEFYDHLADEGHMPKAANSDETYGFIFSNILLLLYEIYLKF